MLLSCLMLSLLVDVTIAQVYAPGVPPPQQQQHHQQQQHQQQQHQQHHQQQHQQQHHQQQQQHIPVQQQQHIPVQQQQQQQVPVQQQQQQQGNVQQMQQAPGGQGHGHGHGHGAPGEPVNFKSEVHNREHIQEHLENVIDKPKEQMTDEELEFHYFKMHDYDNNNKLDGVEIGKALTHYHGDSEEDEVTESLKDNLAKISDEEIARMVDLVLEEDDINQDGYVEYAEFITAQRRAQHKLEETVVTQASDVPLTEQEQQVPDVPPTEQQVP
ncbi:putative mediator of RNA polymerase II transcription subunit 12 isoform X2 [Gigantopelta aegis]|uniref:putative mediator of RNA polymerase II transcription subunit 12 isoform X2 n=1 Tax=Gigantopelta aegis TaxID=1735272 RepID=UPI001B887FC8|nr:putative mediator of RNA polymerase II transcription subunit 12 isoform X2 [Gigantopelta aegis]